MAPYSAVVIRQSAVQPRHRAITDMHAVLVQSSRDLVGNRFELAPLNAGIDHAILDQVVELLLRDAPSWGGTLYEMTRASSSEFSSEPPKVWCIGEAASTACA